MLIGSKADINEIVQWMAIAYAIAKYIEIRTKLHLYMSSR